MSAEKLAIDQVTRRNEQINHSPHTDRYDPFSARSHNDGVTSVESASRRDGEGEEQFRSKRGRSLSVPSADIIGASEQSVALVQSPARDKSALMATLIDRETVQESSHRFNPMA